MSLVSFENTEVFNFAGAIRGVRAPMKSYAKADSGYDEKGEFVIGPNDYRLMKSLCSQGSNEHAKFLRQIIVSVDVNLPRAIHQELDTYKIGADKNSESTIHKLKDETMSSANVQFDWGFDENADKVMEIYMRSMNNLIVKMKQFKIAGLNDKYEQYLHLIKMMLPEGFMQKRVYTFNYQTLSNIYHQRKNHKMPEWHEFCDWIKTLPYSEFITKEWKED